MVLKSKEKGRRSTITMKVRPKIFRWLRESAGYAIKEVADILKVDAKDIQNIEDSKEEYVEIKLSWLRKLAREYKRQLACFFLPEVPEDERNILENINNRYYRYSKQEPIRLGTPIAKELLLADRKARYRRSVIQDIIEDKREEPVKYSINDYPDECARIERSEYINKTGKSKSDFDSIRNYLESYSIYVFQFDLPLDIIRGFTLTDDKPYIIVVNSKDSDKGKLFTLIHEYAHILLREGSYCNISEDSNTNINNVKNVEVWCNRFAASFLMPEDQLTNDIKAKIITDNILKELSDKYGVSKYALAVRLRNIGYHISDKKIDELKQEAEKYIEQKRLEGYLFTWEDISIGESRLKEYDRLFNYIIKRKEIKERYHSNEFERLIIKRTIDETKNKEILEISLDNKRIAIIEPDFDEKKAKLVIEGIENVEELDVKKKDRNGMRHEVYEPIRIPVLNKRKSELGLTYIDNLIEAYNDGKISLYELAEYLDLKIDKVKILIGKINNKNKE
jgi:Zn-dependent peptidase ImmA (M78 family)